MDLSYPIFKLESRAQYERERLAGGVEGMRPCRASSEKGVEWVGSDEDAQRSYDSAVARAEACELAARILKQAQDGKLGPQGKEVW